MRWNIKDTNGDVIKRSPDVKSSRSPARDIAGGIAFVLVVGPIMGLIQGLAGAEWITAVVLYIIAGAILGLSMHIGRGSGS